MAWLKTFKTGDIFVLFLACIGLFLLAHALWQTPAGIATRAIIRARGAIVATVQLPADKTIVVNGPLGPTTIRILDRQIKVDKDPGIRQYCVDQGWLTRPGDIGLCLPNQISIQLLGSDSPYDTLSY